MKFSLNWNVQNQLNVLYYRQKYDAIVIEKTSREQLLLEQVETHMEKVRVLEEYVQLLEKKVSVISTTVSSSQDDEKNATENHLQFYRMMTGMTICPDPSAANRLLCVIKNPQARQLTRFYIENFSERGSEIRFSPEANAELLPEYLRCGVTFDEVLAPLMLGDILQSLFGETSE